MTYASVLQTLKSWVENSTINGKPVWCEVLLEDEIELNPRTSSPCVFICPIPFDMTSLYNNKYNFRIYVAENPTYSPNNITGTGTTLTNRMVVFNECIVYAENMIKLLPDSWLEDFPITFNPVLLWDTFDGIFFDLSINNAILCAEISITGTTGNQFIIGQGTSGTSGSSGSSGKSGYINTITIHDNYTGTTNDNYIRVTNLMEDCYIQLPKSTASGQIIMINNNDTGYNVYVVPTEKSFNEGTALTDYMILSFNDQLTLIDASTTDWDIHDYRLSLG